MRAGSTILLGCYSFSDGLSWPVLVGQLEKQGAGNGTGTGTGTGAGAGPERYRITSLIRAINWV